MAKVNKSHAKLFNENYTYRYNCKCKNTVYYKCVISGCTGRAAVYDSGFIKVTKEHDCIPSVIDQSVKKVKEKLKEQSNDIYATPYEVVTDSLKGINLNIRGSLRTEQSLIRSVRQRRSRKNKRREPTELSDINSENIMTSRNENFCLFDSKDENRIIIFATQENLKAC